MHRAGTARINQLYEDGLKQPDFEVSENAIKIVLPYVPFGKSKTTQLLKDMEKKGVVKIEGRGRGTKYVIK